MLRSEKMDMIVIYLNRDTAKEAVTELGNFEMVHFNNLNGKLTSEQLPHSGEIKHLEKLQGRVKYLSDELEKLEVPIKKHQLPISTKALPMNVVEVEINKHFDRFLMLKEIKAETETYLFKLKEDLCILEETERTFGDTEEVASPEDWKDNVKFISGIIDRDKIIFLQKILTKILRRNLLFNWSPASAFPDKKCTFIVLTHGTSPLNKAKEVCLSLGAKVIDAKDKRFDKKERGLLGVTSLISQISAIEKKNTDNLVGEAKAIAELLHIWKFYTYREMRIYETLNCLKFDSEHDCLIGEAWVPSKCLPELRTLMGNINDVHGNIAFEIVYWKDAIAPTYIPTTVFTAPFQLMSDAYAIPSYKELNPAIFNIFTFPFLFGCMFGDFGHGTMLLLTAIALILYANKKGKNASENIKTLLDSRYTILLCGIHAMFFGLLYNDCFSISLHLFKSQFTNNGTISGYIYPFGLDPGWHGTSNGDLFTNSVKMKMSIILGFLHMLLGAFIGLGNHLYYKDFIGVYCVWIPKFIAFVGFVGYLAFLIIYKWTVSITEPPIINTIVAMYTSPNSDITKEIYKGQQFVQLLILSFIVISIPWMFLSKPLYITLRNIKTKHSLVDLWMESAIETIEFCIGLISNTASYLRLWAVSLAHSRLTAVLHSFTLGKSLFLAVLLFPLWLVATVLLLIGLEGISACLHALRLNWIEFNAKFFQGDGEPFMPLKFSEPEE
ncbi:V-type proton ATPase subunit a [Astathelohania contejeani]|uniref:V-type proton ATPase subunit a n=1 Tax=Astathelohania contejeani TaxID=164912 RepID=A0ABQ7I1E1_9MICR|nr:V-type proton ATPase subunit a [Thelohania contejeani]